MSPRDSVRVEGVMANSAESAPDTTISGNTPVPDSAVEVGLPTALCVITSTATLFPSELGVNATRTNTLSPPAKESVAGFTLNRTESALRRCY